jgi:hypothetical protein
MLTGLERIILLREDVAVEIDVNVLATYKTDDVIRALQTTSGVSTPVLPDGCLLYTSNNKGYEAFVCMRPPTVWSCGGPMTEAAPGSPTFPILLPWQIYIVTLTAGLPSQIKLFFSPVRIISTDQMLYRSLLPNQGDDGYCCVHSDYMKAAGLATTPLILRINKLIHDVSKSNFSDDLQGYQQSICKPISDTVIPTGTQIPGLTSGSGRLEQWLRKLAYWSKLQLEANVPVMTAYENVNLVGYSKLSGLLYNG